MSDQLPTSNPFARPSTVELELPDFDAITDDDFAPAIAAGLAEAGREIDEITHNADAPSVDNTIVALEKSGQLLDRTLSVLFNLIGADGTDERVKIETSISADLAEFASWKHLNSGLFDRIRAVHDQLDSLDLDPESHRLVTKTYDEFVRAGAALDGADRERLADIDRELAELTTAYRQDAVWGLRHGAVHVTDDAELDGVDDAAIEAARAYAEAEGLTGWLFRLFSPTIHPILTQARNRDLRRRLWESSVARGTTATDGESNTQRAVRIAELRAERAALLGFPHHAAWVLAETMAGDIGAVRAMFDQLIGHVKQAATTEQERIAARAARDGVDPLQPWDWPYYQDRITAEEYQLDLDRLRKYFPAERVLRDGVFAVAERLYGITIVERPDLVGYADGTRIFEISADGEALGLLVGDWFTRPTKQGGAWMSTFRSQSKLLDRKPVVANNMNIQPVADGEALLSFDQVTTMFHEFGHALHGLLSEVNYPRFSGTRVSRDFVEFPSQVNEIWAFWPGVIEEYARHVETGEALPVADLADIEAAKRWGLGFSKYEFVAAAVLDLGWHQLPAGRHVDDAATFEADVLAEWGLDNELIAPRYRSGYFTHIFSGGYSAGYYSYLWAEILDAHGEDWFRRQGGPTPQAGDHLRRTVLSRGNSRDVATSFREFAGEDPRIEPLLERYGF